MKYFTLILKELEKDDRSFTTTIDDNNKLGIGKMSL